MATLVVQIELEAKYPPNTEITAIISGAKMVTSKKLFFITLERYSLLMMIQILSMLILSYVGLVRCLKAFFGGYLFDEDFIETW